MSRAFGYLARETAKSYALLSAALLVLFDLLAFLTEAQDIGEANYTLRDALLVILMSTPALLVDLSPFVALLATLLAYDRLNATSELIALRAAGVSGTRLGLVAGGVAAGFMLVIAAVEVAARPLHLQASLLRMHETAPTGNPLRGGGFWIRSGETFVNVAALEDARRPSGIRVFTFSDDSRLTRYQRADVRRDHRRGQLATRRTSGTNAMPPMEHPALSRRRPPRTGNRHGIAASRCTICRSRASACGNCCGVPPDPPTNTSGRKPNEPNCGVASDCRSQRSPTHCSPRRLRC